MKVNAVTQSLTLPTEGGLSRIESPQGNDGIGSLGESGGAHEANFGDALTHMIDQANRADAVAGAKAQALANGSFDDLHGTMISAKEADISLKLVGTIRNRLIDAFHEIWRTSV